MLAPDAFFNGLLGGMARLTQLVLFIALSASAMVAQRTPILINPFGSEDPLGAKISPDGQWVAWVWANGPNLNHGVRKADGSSTMTTVVSAVPHNSNYGFSFTWGWHTPRSGNALRLYRINRRPVFPGVHVEILGYDINATTPGTFFVARLPAGSRDALLQVQPFRNICCGTHISGSGTTFQNTLFWIDISTGAVTSLLTSTEVITPIDMDPAERYVLYAIAKTTGAHELWRIDKDNPGDNRLLIASGPTSQFPKLSGGSFTDGNDAFIGIREQNFVVPGYGAVVTDPTTSLWNYLSSSGLEESFEGVAANPAHLMEPPQSKKWLIGYGIDNTGIHQGRNRVSLLPVEGGGEVVMHRTGNLILQASFDAAGTRVAYIESFGTVGGRNVWTLDLDRELEARPVARIGSSFTVTMPTSAGELIQLYLAGNNQLPQPHPPQIGTWELAQPIVTFLSAPVISPGGPLVGTVLIPNNPALIGVARYLQGTRIDDTGGDITRLVRVRYRP